MKRVKLFGSFNKSKVASTFNEKEFIESIVGTSILDFSGWVHNHIDLFGGHFVYGYEDGSDILFVEKWTGTTYIHMPLSKEYHIEKEYSGIIEGVYSDTDVYTIKSIY